MILAFKIFDFNLAQKITAVSIIGMVLLAIGVILMLASRAIADAIAKRSRRDSGGAETEEKGGNDEDAAKEAERSIYRNADGTRDYYTILKMAALAATVIGCLMTVLGLK